MVKKKGKSKRISLKDKYKIQKRVVETHRKQRKQTKRDAAKGIHRPDKQKRDPGIPNSWPFKQDLLKDIQRARDRQKQNKAESKEKRKTELRELKEHQKEGGTARTVEELMQRANRDKEQFDAKQDGMTGEEGERQRSDGSVEAGQASRRAYLRELKKVVDSADVLLQVLDARDPMGSRIHPSVENTILSRADKRMVLVLNKIDLVPKDVVGQWLKTLRRSQATIAIKASANHDKTAAAVSAQNAEDSSIPVGMEGLLQLLKNYARTGSGDGKSKTTIVVGVIGYPNVGKSSIINALKRTRAVGVSPRPGFTTSMQEVVLDRNVRLLDSPGVVFDDRSAMLGNCVDADSIEDPVPAVSALLQRCTPQSLMMTYSIPAFPPGDTMMFLALVARSYGRVLKGGIPDKVAAARAVLRDWNSGKIPYYTPPPKETNEAAHNDAVIVTNFGDAFDVTKYDDQIMQSLKESDEMDFVEMKEAQQDADDSAPKDAIKFLTGNQGDSDEEMDEDSVEENPRQKSAQTALADADDYDFNDL
mmetsp:Transcript_31381/g.48133  ORF Transcript_31381/g.48133 Transcript_31381/m.48133 type:complete len:532 (+) Transcript_31381:154-1749(+)